MPKRKAPQSEPVQVIGMLTPVPGINKNPFKTRCPGCTSTIHLPLPMVHCPSCHHVYRAKQLTAPSRCPRCDFSLFKWRRRIGIIDESALGALA